MNDPNNNRDKTSIPYWLVRKIGSNNPWEIVKTGQELNFPYEIEIIARSNTPEAVIYYPGQSYSV